MAYFGRSVGKLIEDLQKYDPSMLATTELDGLPCLNTEISLGEVEMLQKDIGLHKVPVLVIGHSGRFPGQAVITKSLGASELRDILG